MKTSTLLSGAMIILVLFCMSLTACDSTLFQDVDVFDSVVRIHIRANSNSPQDQQVKLLVRDNLTKYLSSLLEGCKTKSQSLSVISDALDEIEQIANNTLYQCGYDYTSAVSVKSERFPEKEYDGYVFPEGVYDALIIELGKGTGDNWWCVAFPPLCFVPDNGEGQIVYKSWVKELLDKIFGNNI